jgi:DNA polymerase III subunit gamma/tau
MALTTELRPRKFSDVVGQEVAISALKKLAHSEGVNVRSILLKGSWGSGKTTLARIFGKAVNCEHFKELGDVCDECEGCKAASVKNSQTYIENDSTVVGSVEAVRNMDILFSSAVNGRRVIVFDEVHAASKAAQTALLKPIEEGVKDTFFVFCTTDSVIDTIRSRSLELSITTLPANLIKDRIREVALRRGVLIEEHQLDALALKSKGHMRDALSIYELFELVGDAALKTPLSFLKKLIVQSIRKENVQETLHTIMLYPLVDIQSSIKILLINSFNGESNFDLQLRKQRLHRVLFDFLYSPIAQEAMRDEFGMEILLNALYERLSQ